MKQTLVVYLHAQENLYRVGPDCQPYKFSVWNCDMSSCGYIPLGPSAVEFDIPSPEQVLAGHVVLLRAKIAEVRETAEKQVNELREQLSKLEALTYTPTQEHPDVP